MDPQLRMNAALPEDLPQRKQILVLISRSYKVKMSISHHEPHWSMDPGRDHRHSLGSVENYLAFLCERECVVKGVPCRLPILGLRKFNLPQKVNDGIKNLQRLSTQKSCWRDRSPESCPLPLRCR